MSQERLIPSRSDRIAWQANCDAIDELIGECRWPYIVAWAKFLGCTPHVVQEYIAQAEADKAPPDAIQKFEEGWSTIDDIANDTNRCRVIAIAQRNIDPIYAPARSDINGAGKKGSSR